MKVIKEGSGATTWTKVYKCTGDGNGGWGCGAELEVTFNDLYHTHHHDYGGGHDIYITFECPCCHSETDISNESDVPWKWREKIRDIK